MVSSLTLTALAAAGFASLAAAQYGPGGQYGPDSSGSSSSSGSSGSSSSSSSGSYGGSSFSQGSIPFGGDFAKANRVIIAHGVLASLAWVILFPLGGILIRVASFKGLVAVHAGIQITAYILFTAGVGLGIYMATQIRQLDTYHPIIGLVLFALLFFQPILGWMHHRLFKKYSRRVLWSYGHIWLGRILITLGIINGGLGLHLANNSRKGEIAYGVVGAIVWVTYMASIVYGELKRRKNTPGRTPPPYDKAGVRQGSESLNYGSGNEGSPNRNGEYYAKQESQPHRYV